MATAKPTKAGWESIVDADGKLKADYAVDSSKSKEALQQMSDVALRGAGVDSQWAKMQKEGIGQDAIAQKEQVAQSQMAAQAQAEAKMAMRGGGLSSGATERMSAEGANQTARAQQGVNAQASRAQMGVGIQDESNRMAALKGLPGMDQSAQWGTLMERSTMLKEKAAKRAYSEDQYKQQMKAYTADREAQATEKANEGK